MVENMNNDVDITEYAQGPTITPCPVCRGKGVVSPTMDPCSACSPSLDADKITPPERYVDPERVDLGRNQYDLLTSALSGLLDLLVEDWRADVPVVRDPWEGAGPLGKTSGTGEVWGAINQARAVLGASERWVEG